MPIKPNALEALLKNSFPDAVIIIKDLAGDNNHFEVSIISSLFEGKNKIQQHKMVYSALEGKAGTEIHALSLKTSIP